MVKTSLGHTLNFRRALSFDNKGKELDKLSKRKLKGLLLTSLNEGAVSAEADPSETIQEYHLGILDVFS